MRFFLLLFQFSLISFFLFFFCRHINHIGLSIFLVVDLLVLLCKSRKCSVYNQMSSAEAIMELFSSSLSSIGTEKGSKSTPRTNNILWVVEIFQFLATSISLLCVVTSSNVSNSGKASGL